MKKNDKKKQIFGILGIGCAVIGGVAWFSHQYFPAAIFWGVAGLILLKINKKRKSR